MLSIERKSAQEVLADVLAGNVDFGLMNQPSDVQAIQAHPFCCEAYVLYGAVRSRLQDLPARLDELLSPPLVGYPGMLHGLNRWIGAQFGEANSISALSLRPSGQFNDIRGVLAMVEGDLGCTALPRHVAAGVVDDSRLRALTGVDGQTQRPALQ